MKNPCDPSFSKWSSVLNLHKFNYCSEKGKSEDNTLLNKFRVPQNLPPPSRRSLFRISSATEKNSEKSVNILKHQFRPNEEFQKKSNLSKFKNFYYSD